MQVSLDELYLGFPRKKKASLDEAELMRGYFKLRSGEEGDQHLCIDVGAHYGTSALPLLEDGWKVIGFEPDGENRAILESTLSSYIPDSFIIERFAVSDEGSDKVNFFRSDVSTGISGLSSFHESHILAGSVSTVTLASYAEENSIERVDFLKIDTEGFDFHVIRGIPWQKWRPVAILCEFEDRKTIPLGYTWRDMADYLVQEGYEVWVSEWHPIIEYGQTHDWSRLFCYPGDLADSASWGNLLAFRNPIDPSLMARLFGENIQVHEGSNHE